MAPTCSTPFSMTGSYAVMVPPKMPPWEIP
jgi:hypothetical protein